MKLSKAARSPADILPKSKKQSRLLDIDVSELARQLTIVNIRQHSVITPPELLAYMRGNRFQENRALQKIRSTSNKITSWVVSSVLEEKDLRRRGAVIKHLISLAEVSSSFLVYCRLLTLR
jgi:son of sevenless-like protein